MGQVVNMLEGFVQIRSNAYSVPAKELQPPFSGEEKDVQKGTKSVYPQSMACTVPTTQETFRGHENIFLTALNNISTTREIYAVLTIFIPRKALQSTISTWASNTSNASLQIAFAKVDFPLP